MGRATASRKTREGDVSSDSKRLWEWMQDHRALMVLGAAGALLVTALLVTPQRGEHFPQTALAEDETPLFI